MAKFYTGVGSRATPVDVQLLMINLAKALRGEGYTLLSGGAEGADTAFATGAGEDAVVFRPAARFSPVLEFDPTTRGWIKSYPRDLWKEAHDIALHLHPAWHRLDGFGRALHTRNVFEVLGPDLRSPGEFLLCWTQDAADGREHPITREAGGTGSAIRLAATRGIPVHNLAHGPTRSRFARGLLQLGEPA